MAGISVRIEATIVVRSGVIHRDDKSVRNHGAVATAERIEVHAEPAGCIGAVAVDDDSERLGDDC